MKTISNIQRLSTLESTDSYQVIRTWDSIIDSIKEDAKQNKTGKLNKIKNHLKSLILNTIDESDHYHAILTLLDKHIETWKSEKAIDLVHWRRLLNSNSKYINIISRVLFECMDKNEHNIALIQENIPTDISLFKNFFVEYDKYIKNYPNLKGLELTSEYFDSLFLDPIYMVRLLSYERQDVSENMMNTFKHHIFTNKRLFGKLVKLGTTQYQVVCDYLESSDTKTNISSLLKNFETIFKTRDDQLISLIGLSLTLEHYTSINTNILPIYLEKVNALFKQKYPEDFKNFITCKILGLEEFDVLLDTVKYRYSTATDNNVELPELCI